MTIDFHQLTAQLERVYSPRLALRPVSLSDAWPLFAATRNPQFNRHLLWKQPAEPGPVIARMDALVDAARSGRMAAVSAVVKSTGEWVSLFRFQPYAAIPGAVEMGVWTHDKFWHGRLSLELGRACVDAAFMLSEISTLIGVCTLDNRSSFWLMERCGFVRTRFVYRHSEFDTELKLQEFSLNRVSWESALLEPAFSHAPAAGTEIKLPRHVSAAQLDDPTPPAPLPAISTQGPVLEAKTSLAA
jgi:RimJ/RimL family protein N-acetyltransferase